MAYKHSIQKACVRFVFVFLRGKYIHVLYWVWLLMQAPNAAPQTPPHWRYWLGKDGLGESCSNSVFMGPSGRVWINHGHVEMMSVFDGYIIQNISSPGIGAPVIENPTGSIWSVYEGGVKRYQYADDIQEGNWATYPVSSIENLRVPFYPITYDHVLYASPSALYLFDAKENRETVLMQASNTRLGKINDIWVNRQSTCWLLGFYGAASFQIDLPRRQVVDWREYLVDPSLKVTNPQNPVYTPWAGLFAVGERSKEKKRVLLQFDGERWSIAYEEGRDAVIGGWKEGPDSMWAFFSPFQIVNFHQGKENAIESNKVLSRVLLDFFVEESGSFWLATSEGLARYAPAVWRTPIQAEDMDVVVHSIQEDHYSRMWFLYQDTLICVEENEWKFYPLPAGIASDELNADSLCVLSNEAILIKGTTGVVQFDVEQAVFSSFNYPDRFNIEAISRNDGRALLGMSLNNRFRLDQYDGVNYQTIIECDRAPYLRELRHIFEDRRKTIWFAGLNGLSAYHAGTFRFFTAEDGYSDTAAFYVCQIDDSRIWVGGRDQILEYDGTRWSPIRTTMDSVRKIAPLSDGSVWVASGTGLHRYANGSWTDHTFEDGLPNAAAFEIVEDSRGRIWAGTTRGLSEYQAAADRDPPETILLDEQNNSQITANGAQFVFSGVDKWNYTQPERLLYSYRVDRREWSTFQRGGVAAIHHLEPGNHLFEVRAMDRNWNIDPSPARFAFTVLLPWYRQPVFLLLSGIGSLLLSISLGFHAIHHIHLEKTIASRTRELQAANDQLQADAAKIRETYEQVLNYQEQLKRLSSELSFVEERERRKIAADLHDSIGQTLSLAMIKLESLIASISSEAAAVDIAQLKALIHRTLQTSRSLIYELCPPILYDVGFQAAVEQLVDRFRQEYAVTIDFEIDIGATVLRDEMNYFLFRAIRELLFNVVKHSNATRAGLALFLEGSMLQIQVSDNGIGVKPTMEFTGTSGFGLFSIRERLKQLGGHLIMDSKPNHGTRVILQFPLSTGSKAVDNGS